MNSKKLVVLTVALGLFAISTANVNAQTHRHAGFSPRSSTSHPFIRSGTGTFGGRNFGGDWHHHHHDRSGSTIFISSFGYPFGGFGYPYGYGYGGGYYPYGAGYYGGGCYNSGYYGNGYDGGDYYGGGYYNSGYYGNSYYGGGYYRARAYSNPGYGSYGSGYGHQSSVARLQQQLARAGYYRGSIDGIMGPRTRYALRAYRHDHGARAYGMVDRQPY